MKGRVFKRCTRCNRRVKNRQCAACGSDRYSWSFVVDIGRTPSGARQQRTRQGFATRNEAERALRELLHSVDTQRYVSPTSLTVATFLRDEWLPAVQPPNLRAATWTSYCAETRRHVLPHIGEVPLQQLTPVHLNQLYAKLLTEGRRDGAGGLSPRTVRYIHTILRKALADGVRWGRLERNIADLADPPRQVTSLHGGHMQIWSAEQLRLFLDHVADDRLHPAWLLAATTGMRRAEVLGLRWIDVDLDAAGWQCARPTSASTVGRSSPSRRRAAADGPSTSTFARPASCASGRTGRPRNAPLGTARGRSTAWSSPGRTEHRSSRMPSPRRSCSVPVRRDSRRSDSTISGTRTPACYLPLAVNPKVASERLGHHSVAFTLDVYSHVIPGMQSEAAERIAGLVLGDDDDPHDTPPQDVSDS